MNEDGKLVSVTERTKIEKSGDIAVSIEDGVEYKIPLDAVVSMNCWGFTPDIFAKIEEGFQNFLSTPQKDPMKCEYYLPLAVTEMMDKGQCEVKLYKSYDSWYGVTYADDKEKVKSSIAELIKSGKYPTKLN